MAHPLKIAILISGRGSNMMSLLAACEAPDFPAIPVIIVSNQSDAPGLQAAQKAGITTASLVRKDYASRETYDNALNDILKKHGVELICLAGFMQILSKDFVEKWHNRILNIHPSLLPSFKGLNTHQRALDAGVKFSGCTVHYVRYEMDTGPIISQAVVPVLEDDTADTLAARVLMEEHRIYPKALKLVATGTVYVEGDRLISKE